MAWDVMGHDWAVNLLRQHLSRGEVRHAYLLCGAPGVGRRTLALRFAQALFCPQPTAPGEPCGVCRACQQTLNMQFPDLHLLSAETVGGSLRVDTIRELQRSLSLAPFQASRRVALLLRFEEATESTQNALLKTLEEAPERAILILTAVSPESLLPTITSRCEILRLRPMGVEALGAALHQQRGLPVEEARRLAHLSSGRVGVALQMHAQPELLEKRRAYLDDLRMLLGAPHRDRFTYAKKAAEYGRSDQRSGMVEDLRRRLEVWQSVWRDVMLLQSGVEVPLVNLDDRGAVERLAQQCPPGEVAARVRELEEAQDALDANVNPRLLFENLALNWPRVVLD